MTTIPTPSQIYDLFNLDYNYNELNNISKTLKILVEKGMIHGFGIYTKKDTTQSLTEFVIVIKIEAGKGKNWMMMHYKKEKEYVYHRVEKKGKMGPLELYSDLNEPKKFEFGAYSISDLNTIIRGADIVQPYWEGSNIEYNIGDFKKYGGRYNNSRRKFVRKNNKRSYNKYLSIIS